LYLTLLALVLLTLFAGSLGSISGVSQELSGSLAMTIIAFVVFFLNWGYFVLFEALNNGQTPGKRWTGIRVVRDSGLPLDGAKRHSEISCALPISCRLRPALLRPVHAPVEAWQAA
jgi:uncharacterized RDD family membrane protein YckC